MVYLVAFVVLVLATARLTRLLSKDDLTIPLRLWIDRRFGENSLMARMIWCLWCSGVWASMLTSAMALTIGWQWWAWSLGAVLAGFPLLVLATAYGASWIVEIETREH